MQVCLTAPGLPAALTQLVEYGFRKAGVPSSILGRPTTCPYGNPIPGSDYHDPSAVPLSGLDVGASFTITCIPEELEFTPGVLDFLEENTVLPGRNGTLTASSPDGSVTVNINERVVGLGTFASSRILVLPAPAPA